MNLWQVRHRTPGLQQNKENNYVLSGLDTTSIHKLSFRLSHISLIRFRWWPVRDEAKRGILTVWAADDWDHSVSMKFHEYPIFMITIPLKFQGPDMACLGLWPMIGCHWFYESRGVTTTPIKKLAHTLGFLLLHCYLEIRIIATVDNIPHCSTTRGPGGKACCRKLDANRSDSDCVASTVNAITCWPLQHVRLPVEKLAQAPALLLQPRTNNLRQSRLRGLSHMASVHSAAL